MCMHVCALLCPHVCYAMHVGAIRQFVGISFCLLPYGLWSLDSGHRLDSRCLYLMSPPIGAKCGSYDM